MWAATQQAVSALHSLNPSCPRETWVRIGIAAKAAGLSFEEFHSWSQQGENYVSERDCRRNWDSFSADGKITHRTLFSLAYMQGWRSSIKALKGTSTRNGDDSESKHDDYAIKEHISAEAVWAMCEPATPQHDYIIRKQGVAEGLKVYPANGSLIIKGLAMAGALVVPCFSPDSRLLTLQFITKNGAKLNLPKSSFENGFYVLGPSAEAKTIFIVEGIGQAWATLKSTGCSAAVSFGAGRMSVVGRALRQQYPSARLIVLPDRGAESCAEAVAREIAGDWCELPQEMGKNADANDYMISNGEAALAEILRNVKTPSRSEARLKLLGREELRALPTLRWRIHGVLPATGLAAIYGPSAAGKSFLGFDMAMAAAEGTNWFGHRVEAAPVVYVALEGEVGFRMRVAAWETHHQRMLPEKFGMVLQPFNLTSLADIHELGALVPAGAVVIIDTLNRAAPTSDENSSRDMGEILEATKQLQILTSGLIILVHHTGKDAARGLRGHSSLFAALDAAIEVSRSGSKRAWRLAKSKDGKEDGDHPFQLQVKSLGSDDYGTPYTSCVVVQDQATALAEKLGVPKGRNQKQVFDALRREINQNGSVGKPSAPDRIPCIERIAALEIAASSLAVKDDRKNERAKVAITSLVDQGLIGINDAWVWLC